MNGILLAVGGHDLWYALPLIVSISLVYSATRNEQMGPILTHALRFGAWVVGLMLVVMLLLMYMERFV